LGLPYTEDRAVSESLRIKRPRQECFNCLSINHRVQECPVRIDQERIEFNKNQFTSQSQQSQEQAQLFSTRYTSDLDSKSNRGYVPGKISDQLREALGLKPNQIPPFIYIMREYGYPPGWLVEAKVASTKLAVHDGADAIKSETITSIDKKEEGALSDEGL
jgi:zinc finger CCHC domain-containing protein 8